VVTRSDITGELSLGMSTLREQFGRRLRTIRLERRLTQEQLAELLGISVDFLSLIERGINAPSFETIERISSRLDIPISALFSSERPKGGKGR
jgi:transcriptional regulator with XRE-family HTH domain